jgi:hypothetical protein
MLNQLVYISLNKVQLANIPILCVESLRAAYHFTAVGFFFRMSTDMDLEHIGREEGFPTSVFFTGILVFPYT